MNELHERLGGTKELEPNEGQRGLLCSNKVPFRCPSLGLNGHLFSQETVDALDELGDVIWGIRKRLMSEGYEVKDGKIYKNGIQQQN